MVPDPSGHFQERPYFPDGEIDGIMSQVLEAAGNPRLPGRPAVDVDVVMLKLQIEPEYTELPNGVLGVTRFSSSGVPFIAVSDQLESDSRGNVTAFHRLRTTQAHEIGHATLHAPLYVQVNVSAGVTLGQLPSCDGVQSAPAPHYTGEWWEYQANVAMAALLMPESDFRDESSTWCRGHRVRDTKRIRSQTKFDSYVEWMSEQFCVSRQAARIRAKVLGMSPDQ
jgi:Zn-dependent peptidase ImmA (M78 family)